MAVRLIIYKKGSTIPELPGNTLEHSTELFHVYERTRGYSPFLIVAYNGEHPIAKLLAVVRRSARLFPLSIIKRCEIYRYGEYFDTSLNKENLFGEMLECLTQEVLHQVFLIEFRNLNQPLFGYKNFRKNNYFSINRLRVYNSLHSLPPQERLSYRRKQQINKAISRGVITKPAETREEFEIFFKVLGKTYRSQIKKHFPDINFFRSLIQQCSNKEIAKIFLVKYKNKIIGGSFCIYSDNNAYLWFSCGMKKTYPWLYPGVMAIWSALNYAYEKGYNHFEFIDTGFSLKKLGYRDFILSFGGKQVSTRRWFRCSWDWLNKLFYLFYR